MSDKLSMRIYILTLIFMLLLGSCGQEFKSRRASFEGADTNDFVILDCQESSGSICAQPPMPECPEGMLCAQVMPVPQTYANECEMKKVGATFIQNGDCPSGSL
jgi:hypothetical protein